jgi:hypothetical protein
MSISKGERVQAFTDAVRSRDGRCVISGQENLLAQYDEWWGYQAAHVFPLAYIDSFSQYKTEFNITIPGKNGDINSVQNGMLLRNDLHGLFDHNLVSILPSVCVLYLLAIS